MHRKISNSIHSSIHPVPLIAFEHLSISMVIWNGPSRPRHFYTYEWLKTTLEWPKVVFDVIWMGGIWIEMCFCNWVAVIRSAVSEISRFAPFYVFSPGILLKTTTSKKELTLVPPCHFTNNNAPVWKRGGLNICGFLGYLALSDSWVRQWSVTKPTQGVASQGQNRFYAQALVS